MFRNYLLMFWRILLRNKVYAAINIVGLALGIASCLLIFLYVQDEVGYDQHFKDSERIYRVITEYDKNGDRSRFAGTLGPVANALKEEYPEIEQATQVVNRGSGALTWEGKSFHAWPIIYADSNFFSVLLYPFVIGNPTTALDEPASIVLRDDLAQNFFGSADAAIGKQVNYSGSTFIVTGVIKQTQKSHLKPSVIIPLHWDKATEIQATNWNYGIPSFAYIKLHTQDQEGSLQANLPVFYKNKVKNRLKADGSYLMITGFQIQKITDAYLDYELEGVMGEVGNKHYVYLFSVVAVFILLIASINFINLTTARSSTRAREVGMRKTVGASRADLIQQFLIESVVLTTVATILGLSFVEVMLPVFNAITGKDISSTFFKSYELSIAILAIIVLVGVVAGSYPAFFLSHYKPTEAFKLNFLPRTGNSLLQRGLVIVQFTISLILIIGTIVVYSQMLYIKQFNLGFNNEQVITMNIPSIEWEKQKEKLAILKKELLTVPQIKNTSSTPVLPGGGIFGGDLKVEIDNKMVTRNVNFIGVDYDYLDLLEIPVVAGRNFSKDILTDETHSFLVNEAAAKEFGWINPINKKILLPFADTVNSKVIGVVKDYNYKSLHSRIEPLVIALHPHMGTLLVRTHSNAKISSTLQDMNIIWKKHFPDHPMDYKFLNEHFNQQYSAEEKMLTIFIYFAAVTFLIACMGLFGLASFTAEQRTKEIGIRKVLGGSVSDIVLLLSKDFAVLVFISILIACPLAWYGMNIWLQDFAYRTELNWITFAVAAIATLAIALLTVSSQAFKAATHDPVKAIRAQ